MWSQYSQQTGFQESLGLWNPISVKVGAGMIGEIF